MSAAHPATITDQTPIDLSVIAPAHNEEGNVAALVDQVGAALAKLSPLKGEFIIVDDGSTDTTRAKILELMASRPWLRCVAMQNTPPGKGNGQSAAFHAGFRFCRGKLIATLDADLQNDPLDLVDMHRMMQSTGAGMVQGDRSHARKDSAFKRIQSVIGRYFRGFILADVVRDTGCSLRLMKREIALALPLEFRGMHRFIPITAVKLGHRVVEMRVNHRARTAGETKYGFGVAQRAIPGLIDCFAVRWMANRRRPVTGLELGAGTPAPGIAVELKPADRSLSESQA